MLKSVKELAKSLGISPKTVYALVSRDEIPFTRIGVGRGTLRFDIDEVKEELRKKTRGHSHQRLSKPQTKHLL
ncbi:MAG: helix-turn-helix domain-containing protein [Planctomycetales bacterium]|nr:helix-turn-helix domain-containing protein [Planctomycetales bacterium]